MAEITIRQVETFAQPKINSAIIVEKKDITKNYAEVRSESLLWWHTTKKRSEDDKDLPSEPDSPFLLSIVAVAPSC